MPVALSFPGVYIEEVPSGVRAIAGVATSIAAFVGFTRKGVPDKAVTITNFSDFERGYGGLDRDSPVSYGVRQFFANGGTQAIIVRVATGVASAAWVLQDSAPADVLDVSASSPGAWGNDLRVSVDRAGARNPDAEFNLIVSQLQPDGVTLVPVETHRNLNLDSNSSQYVESVVNSASALVAAKRRAGLTFNQAGFAVSAAIAFPLSVSDRVIAGTVDGTTTFRLTLTSTPASMPLLVTAVNAAIATAGLNAMLQASDSGPDGGAGTGCLKLTSLHPGESSSVVIAGGAFGVLANVIHVGMSNGGREFAGNAQHRPANVSNVVPPTKGIDGSRGGAVELVGTPSAKTGLNALLDVDQFNILCIPETFDMADAQAAAVIPAAVDLCERRRAFYIVDAPSAKNLSNIAAWANGVTQSRNAAVYFPSLRTPDPLDGLRPRAAAPSGTMAGVYARTDATRGVWKAPAGTDATLNGVLDLTSPLSDAENGLINPKGVNALRSFPAFGRVAWGARTLKGSDAQADEYKYVPVRRLALFLEESLYRGTQWVVFEPNDEPLWAQIRLNIGAFMQGLFRQGAFQGRTPKEAYFVKCDAETTTQADINLGIVNIIVGFAPLKPAEFVVLKLQQIAGDVPQLMLARWIPTEESFMAQFSVNAQRFDPYKNFKFRIKWDGRFVAGISKVSALKRSTEVVEHREGGDPSTGRKSPGRTKFEAITLERGVTHDTEFEKWANKVWNFGAGLGLETSLKDFRKDLILEVYNEAGQLAIAYKIFRCWVSEFQALPDLDANANAVAIQHLKLENEGWERDIEVGEPTEPRFTEPA